MCDLSVAERIEHSPHASAVANQGIGPYTFRQWNSDTRDCWLGSYNIRSLGPGIAISDRVFTLRMICYGTGFARSVKRLR